MKLHYQIGGSGEGILSHFYRRACVLIIYLTFFNVPSLFLRPLDPPLHLHVRNCWNTQFTRLHIQISMIQLTSLNKKAFSQVYSVKHFEFEWVYRNQMF